MSRCRWRPDELALAARAGHGRVAALVGTFAATGAYIATSGQLVAAVDESLSARAERGVDGQSVRRTTAVPGRPGTGGPRRRRRARPPATLQPATAAQLVAPDGTVTACIDGGPALPVDDADWRSLSATGSPAARRSRSTARSYRLADRGAGRTAASIQVAAQPRRGGATCSPRCASAWSRWPAPAIAVAGLLGWLVARRIVRPVVAAPRHGGVDRDDAGPHDADPGRRAPARSAAWPAASRRWSARWPRRASSSSGCHRRQPRDAHAADEPAHEPRAARAARPAAGRPSGPRCSGPSRSTSASSPTS